VVIGTGLIGTSVALAARRAGVTVYLADQDASIARAAAALGAGLATAPGERVDLAVVAVPPGQVAPVLARAQADGLASAYTDVASVKGEPEREVLLMAPDPARYVGGHPMAGRERSGPASANLFDGRSWALTPSALTDHDVLECGVELVRRCGAEPVTLPSAEHDEVVALTSHVPHLVASLMAARLAEVPGASLRLAGAGLRDVTRIAGGDPELWADIVRANAPAVARVVRDMRMDMDRLTLALEGLAGVSDRTGALAVVTELLARGAAGAGRMAGCGPVVQAIRRH